MGSFNYRETEEGVIMQNLELDRRAVLHKGAAFAVSLLFGGLYAGCGPSGGSKTVVTGTPPPSGGTTTNVSAALTARYGTPQTRSTTHGSKIISVGGVSGENIVYTVNSARDDSTSPQNKTVRTGDTIEVFDLVNGSRLAFTVA
jgi:hypothetical protein